MAIVTIPGGSNFGYTTGDGFLNYGALAETSGSAYASFPVYFVLPYSGYINYASVSVDPEPAAASSTYSVHNLDTALTQSGLLPVGSGVKKNNVTLPDSGGSALTFSAGDRIIWSADNDFSTTTDTVLTTFCNLTVGAKEMYCLALSLIGGFNVNGFPFSYGAGAHNGVGGKLEMRLPITCELVAWSATVNEGGSAISSDADFNVLNGGNNVGSFTVSSGNTIGHAVLGTPIPFNRGNIFSLQSGSSVPALDHAVVLLFFEVL